ncbi:type II secretion system F family protein [Salinispirillum marinum]|uniref:Type II secretion system F family protein n=2 Tax=Saccharospirillaceae TaxID=255527 RepID=A0ABV8BEI2_9GAMM
MPHFAIKGRDDNGHMVNSVLEARSMDAVLDELKRQRIIPVSITPTKQGKRSASVSNNVSTGDARAGFSWLALFKRLNQKPITADDLILFCRQMYALTRSGIPLLRAIGGLAEATQNPRLAGVLKDVGRTLTAGNPLATALAQHPKIFPPIFLALVSMGESTGRLDTSFKQLITHLELEKNTKRQMKSATRYPTFVVIALVVAVSVINVFVVPNFANVFDRLGEDLPIFTRILLESSNFTVQNGPFILAGAVAAFLGWRQYSHTEQGALKRDQWKLYLPLVGSVFRRVAMSRFTRSFAMMMDAGVPILQALSVSARTTDNAYIGSKIEAMAASIERGESLLAVAKGSGLFNALLLQMIGVGEETGNLAELLRDIADFYGQEVEHDLKNMSQAIEPILIFAMGGLVLILALGIFLPMWDLSAGAGGL